MRVVLTLIGALVANLLKSRHRLEVENLFLRHQLSIALRRAPHRVYLRGCDRALLVWLTWFWPSLLGLSRVVQPETILRWHRAGLRAYWRRKSRGQPGRPKVSRELRELVRRMNKDNPLWGAPRIHGELLKLGFTIVELTVSKYMVKHRPLMTMATFCASVFNLAVSGGAPCPYSGTVKTSKIPMTSSRFIVLPVYFTATAGEVAY